MSAHPGVHAVASLMLRAQRLRVLWIWILVSLSYAQPSLSSRASIPTYHKEVEGCSVSGCGLTCYGAG